MTTALQKIEFHPTVTAMEIWEKLPEGVRAEVIDNRLYILPSPTPYHQDVLGTLNHQLCDFVIESNLGKVWYSPVDLFLDTSEESAVIPDIIFIATDNKTLVDRRGLFGVPDLLIEILSRNKNHDFVTKKNLYERTGVKEYWLVDPETKNAAGFLLKDHKYGDPLILNGEINIRIISKSIKF